MLPYRLRAPVYGGKLKQQKNQEAPPNGDPLAGGGPVQCAMEKDLLELRPAFLEALRETRSSANANHDDIGGAFGAFRHIFAKSKLALLHTRTVPPRCDRDSYSQLLYSACLSLITKALQEENLTLEHASFATFCLHTLYETNPLPVQTDNPLQMLSFGVQSTENPKLLYRRAFRTRIRVDRFHFATLQHLRDDALARQADCQLRRMQAWELRLCTKAQELDWSCTCGVAVDTVHVVDRLCSSLEYGEYTGPCGLESLAGHADYPYRCIRPNKKFKASEHNKYNVRMMTNEELRCVAAEPFELSENMKRVMGQYCDTIQSIQLPSRSTKGSYQGARIREVLSPIYDRQSQSSWQQVLEQMFASEVVPVAPASPPLGTSTRLPGLTPASQGLLGDMVIAAPPSTMKTSYSNGLPAAARDEGFLASVSYHLVLPPDIPAKVQAAIQRSFDTLVERDEVLVEAATIVLDLERAHEGTNCPSVDGELDEESGVVSEVGSLHSTATGQGKDALRALLSSVMSRAEVLKPPRATETGSDDLSSVGKGGVTVTSNGTGQGRDALRMLLSNALIRDEVRKPPRASRQVETGFDDLVSVGNDGGSVASSQTGQGRDSLRTLLSSVLPRDKNRKQHHAPPQGTRNSPATLLQVKTLFDDLSSVGNGGGTVASSQTGQGRDALRMLLSSAVTRDEIRKPPSAPRHGPTRQSATLSQLETGSDDLSSAGNGGVTVASSQTGQGRDALRTLLSRALARDQVLKHTPRKGAASLPVGSDGGNVASSKTGQGRATQRSFVSNMPSKRAAVEGVPAVVVPAPRNDSNALSRHSGDLFLAMDSTDFSQGQVKWGQDSDMSSVSSDEDELSLAASAMGQRALRSLLSAVHNHGKSQLNASKKVYRKQKPVMNSMKPPIRKARLKSATRKPSSASENPGQTRRFTPTSKTSDDHSMPSIRATGKAALDALLSQVADDQGDNGN